MEDLIKNFEQKVDDLKGKTATKEELTQLKADFEALKESSIDKALVDDLTAKMNEAGLRLNTLETKGANSNQDPFKGLVDFLEENKEAIIKERSARTVASYELKAVEGITTGNVTAQAGGNVVAMSQNLGFVVPTPDNALFAEGIMNSTPVDLDTIVWIDEVAKDGDAGMTEEGGTKSQSDVTYVEKTVALENVTHFMKISTKMLSQPTYIVNAVRSRLLRRLQLKKQQQLLSGNGTAPQISGIKTLAPAFVAGTFADSVIQPNVNDLIRVCVAKISQAGEDFAPNYAIVSHKTLADMDLKKAEDGHYVLPPFSTLDNRTIAGVRVIASNEFSDNELLVGDFTKANYAYKGSIQISVGLDGNDFTKNMRTILAEQPIALFVSTNELGAFVKVANITNALADISQPAV